MEREIGSKGIGGFEKNKNKKNQKIIKTNSKSKI